MDTLTHDDSRNSFIDGIFANMFATLTSGAFLTGFALYLGMDEFMIGLLGAIPFIATVFQLPASYFVQRYGVRKKTCLLGAAIARIVWFPILITTFVPLPDEKFRLHVILLLFLISHTCVTISYLAWMSWMSDLVPDNIRGSFFGARNMLVGVGGMIAMVVFGKLLDFSKNHLHNGIPIGLSVTFLSAIVFGAVSLRFLNKVYEPPPVTSHTPVSFWSNLNLPLKEANFRRLLAFAFCWSFAVYFASPFFTLYYEIKDPAPENWSCFTMIRIERMMISIGNWNTAGISSVKPGGQWSALPQVKEWKLIYDNMKKDGSLFCDFEFAQSFVINFSIKIGIEGSHSKNNRYSLRIFSSHSAFRNLIKII